MSVIKPAVLAGIRRYMYSPHALVFNTCVVLCVNTTNGMSPIVGNTVFETLPEITWRNTYNDASIKLGQASSAMISNRCYIAVGCKNCNGSTVLIRKTRRILSFTTGGGLEYPISNIVTPLLCNFGKNKVIACGGILTGGAYATDCYIGLLIGSGKHVAIEWKHIGNLPHGVNDGVITYIGNNTILLTGGRTSNGISTTCYIGKVNDNMTSITWKPIVLDGFGTRIKHQVIYHRKHLYIIGGASNVGEPSTNVILVYKHKNGGFYYHKHMYVVDHNNNEFSLSGHTAFCYMNRIYIIGGVGNYDKVWNVPIS